MSWNIADAKQRFSELIKQAVAEPQLIYNRKRLVAAVIDAEDYQAFKAWSEQRAARPLADELARRKPDPGIIAWAGGVTRLAISVITIDAIHFGLARRPNERVRAWVEALFLRHPVLEVTAPIAQRAGELRGALAARGSIRHQADMLIAATGDA